MTQSATQSVAQVKHELDINSLSQSLHTSLLVTHPQPMPALDTDFDLKYSLPLTKMQANPIVQELDTIRHLVHKVLVETNDASVTNGFGIPPMGRNGGAGGVGAGADDNSYLLGAFSIPQEAFNPNHFQQMLQSVITNMGDIGRNATVMSRTSEDGSSVDVQINLAQMPAQNECRQRVSQAMRFVGYINALIDVIERPDAIPAGVGVAVSTGSADGNANNLINGFSLDANSMGSLEAQLAAQAAAQSFAAVSNGFGIPLVTGSQIIIQGPTVTQSHGSGIHIQTPIVPNPSPNNASPTNTTTTTTTGANSTNPNRPTDGQQQQTVTPVVAADVNQLLTTVFQTQERLRPHVQRLQQLMTTEGQLTEQQISEAQSLQRNCMRANHHLAHVFHLISDLAIQWNTPNRTVGLIHSMVGQPFVGQSVPVSFATRQTGQRNGTQSTDNMSTTTTPSTQSPTDTTPSAPTAAPQPQPQSTPTAYPRFGANVSVDPQTGAAVFSQTTPIVVMELGSTVHQIPVPNPNH
ncbi:unnamed protein product [Oppiella nova]|uniref:Large proline-rich protein BAG6 domain-containing protein n=1 Tax=Oppiella nova TaxID=334625 RepID=A0A7R9M3C0_9ACAR|nr:unnamed protein product [Oppiella nova]CAG2169981.1 unnamed protein product [Oppiella nova]